jgi:hypothetical protein
MCAKSVSSISSCRRLSEETCIEFSKLLCLELGLQSIGVSDRHIKISLKWNPIPFLLHKPLCVWELGSQRILTRIACHLNWPCVPHANAAHTEPCSGHSYLNCISLQLGVNVRCIRLGGCLLKCRFKGICRVL